MNQDVPYNQDSEESLIGSALINPGVLDQVDIRADQFYLRRLGKIWQAILEVHEAGLDIDFITVSNRLTTKGQLESVGGSAFLATLASRTATSLHAESYAQIVREYAQRRAAIRIANALATAAHDTSKPIEGAVSEVITDLHSAATTPERLQPVALWAHESALKIRDTKEMADSGRLTMLSTGYPDIDRIIGGGLYAAGEGTYMLIAGPPGLGKSIFVGNVLEHIAESGHAVALFSLEMKRHALMMRSFAARHKMSAVAMRKGALSFPEVEAIEKGAHAYDDLPVYGSDSTRWTTGAIRSELLRVKHEYGVEVFMVDYLGLLQDETKYRDKHDHQAEIGLRLRSICRDLGMAGIVIHTMTKEGWKAKSPEQEHLAGSASLMHEPDITFIMSKSATYRDANSFATVDFKAVKQRHSEGEQHTATLGRRFDIPLFVSPDPAGLASLKKAGSVFDLS